MMTGSQKLGRYKLLYKLASGGMADIFRAQLHGVEGFQKDYVIKKILSQWSSDHEFISMLVDEAKVLVHLTHPNIVQVFELDEDKGVYFLVMEFVKGCDLRQLIRSFKSHHQRMPIPMALYILLALCDGLQFAHDRCDESGSPLGIVHRDISPQNVLISQEGQVKLTDFGIAKARGNSAETQVGTLKGKFSYMSPEQARGAVVDHRSDIFALGVLLYECVTGQSCFRRTTDLETLEAVKSAPIIFDNESCVFLDQEFRRIILQATEKNPNKRYQSASEFAEALRDYEERFEIPFSRLKLKSLLKFVLSTPEDHPNVELEESLAATLVHETTLKKTAQKAKRVTKVMMVESNQASKPSIEHLNSGIIAGKVLTNHHFFSFLFSRPYVYWSVVIIMALLCVIFLWGVRMYLAPQDSQVSRTSIIPSETFTEKKLANLETSLSHELSDTLEHSKKVKAQTVTQQQTIFPIELGVQVKPEDAIITVKYQGKMIEKSGSVDIKDNVLSNTDISLSVESPGYQAIHEKIKLTSEENTFLKFYELEKLGQGTINVVARPWGRVTIPNFAKGFEAPFVKKIPVGEYKVTVTYPPGKKSVSRSIKILPDRQVTCRATFMPKITMTCR